MSARRRFAALVAAPLLLGAAVYVFLRPSEAWFVRVLGDSPLGAPIHRVRAVTVPIGAYVPSFVLDAAPDLAWAFVVGAFLALVWRERPGTSARAWFGAGLAATLGYEIAQRFHLVPGTFDPLDLVAQAIGYVSGWKLAQSHFFALNQTTMPMATQAISPSA